MHIWFPNLDLKGGCQLCCTSLECHAQLSQQIRGVGLKWLIHTFTELKYVLMRFLL